MRDRIKGSLDFKANFSNSVTSTSSRNQSPFSKSEIEITQTVFSRINSFSRILIKYLNI
jgi:hypothetical protein